MATAVFSEGDSSITLPAPVYLASETDAVIARLEILVERCWKDQFHPDRTGPHHQRWLASPTKHEMDALLREAQNP